MGQTKIQTLLLGALFITATGCEKGNNSYSLLPEAVTFQEVAYQPRSIDILWVIDNSGSMETSQTSLSQNFSTFAQGLVSKQFDFKMAVTTTDAYLGQYNGNSSLFRFRDGVGSTHSGFFTLDRLTPNIVNNFTINATQGISGSGDERAFQSMMAALNYSGNSGFKRPGSHLAVIVLSDEDDFSATTSSMIAPNYTHPNIVPVQTYANSLNAIAGTNDISHGVHNWSFNTIAILDQACKTQLATSFTGRIVGQRYIQLSDLSGGAKTSLCDSFGTSLQLISDLIITASSTYKLEREPLIGSIRVFVNGQSVVENSQNGWTYDPASMVISFHGTAIPSAGAAVSITFDPAKPKL